MPKTLTKPGKNGVFRTKAKKTKRRVVKVEIDDPNLQDGLLSIELIGRTPLVVHRFSEKIQKGMLKKQMGESVGKKAPKNPEQEFLDAFHVIGKRPRSVEDLRKTRFGFPVVAFKSAVVEMSLQEGEKKTQMRRRMLFLPEWDNLVEIHTPEVPVMRQDPVRLQGSSADIRFRPEFTNWSCTVRVEYDPRIISAKDLVKLFAKAGKYNGIGEMRCGGKNSSGINGAWTIGKIRAEEPDLNKEDSK